MKKSRESTKLDSSPLYNLKNIIIEKTRKIKKTMTDLDFIERLFIHNDFELNFEFYFIIMVKKLFSIFY